MYNLCTMLLYCSIPVHCVRNKDIIIIIIFIIIIILYIVRLLRKTLSDIPFCGRRGFFLDIICHYMWGFNSNICNVSLYIYMCITIYVMYHYIYMCITIYVMHHYIYMCITIYVMYHICIYLIYDMCIIHWVTRIQNTSMI